ncbi:hypothetical protein H5410_022090 [Solanum commersonii]|uniref:Uncharacterized protein n=1 Tax=Solanum commersonii TaxID=4109 RepID=A0A9J5ZD71_SOLCO|nr:hypothetical protein H5410_022090 [Solanum commersonii]
MASKDKLHENEAVEIPQKLLEEKKNLMDKRSIILPRVVRIYLTDNDATNSASEEEENFQGEKSKQQKTDLKKFRITGAWSSNSSLLISSGLPEFEFRHGGWTMFVMWVWRRSKELGFVYWLLIGSGSSEMEMRRRGLWWLGSLNSGGGCCLVEDPPISIISSPSSSLLVDHCTAGGRQKFRVRLQQRGWWLYSCSKKNCVLLKYSLINLEMEL